MSDLTEQRFILLTQDLPNEPWRPQVLNESGLGRFFENQHYTADPYPYKLLWASESGQTFSVDILWTTTQYDRDDYADAVGVLKAAGMRVIGHIGYRVDGRA